VSEDPATYEHAVTPLGRTAQSLLWRRWPEFFIEFVLIIVGILTALAIDGWVQDRKDRSAELTYLELLSGDLIEIEDQLQRYVDFESDNLATSAALFHALGPSSKDRDPDRLRADLARLSARRTLQIESVTFTDLQSTGNLQIISNRDLRRRIVRYFSQTERRELIIEKNNTAFVDNLYLPFLFEAGITNSFTAPDELSLVEAEGHLLEALGDDVSWPRDETLFEPPDAPSWVDLRRHVIFRAKVASLGVMSGRRAIEATREIRAAIEEELGNPI
jgi:hypothetical protein